jgi:hypothetical protein
MSSGLLLFARYAYPPNLLGYCGPADHAALSGYLGEDRDDGGLKGLAQRFEGAYPYLRLIAEANGVEDPFDSRVVEAYWIGNALLERVGVPSFFESLKERFRPRMQRSELSWLARTLAGGSKPHHNFHVFDIYRRAGLMRDDRASIALDRMDQCRISWGRVIAVEGVELIVDRSPLALVDGRLALGPAVAMRITGNARRDELRPGDIVSIHWNWACDRLNAAALRALVHCTRRAMADANLTM